MFSCSGWLSKKKFLSRWMKSNDFNLYATRGVKVLFYYTIYIKDSKEFFFYQSRERIIIPVLWNVHFFLLHNELFFVKKLNWKTTKLNHLCANVSFLCWWLIYSWINRYNKHWKILFYRYSFKISLMLHTEVNNKERKMPRIQLQLLKSYVLGEFTFSGKTKAWKKSFF